MTVEELKAKWDSGENVVLLDVREARELAVARFPKPVVHVPLGQLAARLAELPKGETIVCACRSGGRSANAAAFLKAHGYAAVNLEGGILAWSARIDPSVPRY